MTGRENISANPQNPPKVRIVYDMTMAPYISIGRHGYGAIEKNGEIGIEGKAFRSGVMMTPLLHPSQEINMNLPSVTSLSSV